MTKILFRRVLLFLAACVLLYSCRIEDDLIAEKNGENKARKFRALTSKDGEPVNYSHGFKYLLERYDKLHDTEFTRKTVLKNNKFAGKNTPEFIEFNIHSQDLIRNKGTERWIMYPVIKNNEVSGIAIAILKEEETNLQFWRLDEKDEYYKVVKDIFQAQYNKSVMGMTLSRGRDKKCGFEGEEPCEIPEVTINVPGNGPKGTPLMYLPGSAAAGGGYCQTYGNCYGDSGNDDGGGGDPSNPPADTIKTPCEKAVANNLGAKTLLDNTAIKNKKDSLTATHSTDTNEKSFSFGKNSTGKYKTTGIITGTGGSSVGVKATATGMTVEGGIHTHTKDLYACFSTGDFYAFNSANKANSSFKYFYVLAADGSAYVLTITNPADFAAFVTNYPMATYFDATTGGWNPKSSIGVYFENAKDQFIKAGKSEDEAFEKATTMVAAKYNTGISLSKQNASGNFESVFVKENTNYIFIAGTPVPITSYEETTDCNLK